MEDLKTIDTYLDRLTDELNNAFTDEHNDCPLTPSEIIQHAFLLTQYQHGNAPVTFNEFAEYFREELMGDPSVDDVNAHLEADCRDDDLFYSNDPATFRERLCGMDAWDIAMNLTSQWNPSDDYFYFDGYGHIRSCSEYEIIHDYKDETIEYLWDTNAFSGNAELEDVYESAELIIEYCNRMLRDGF